MILVRDDRPLGWRVAALAIFLFLASAGAEHDTPQADASRPGALAPSHATGVPIVDGDFMLSGPRMDEQLELHRAHAKTRGRGVTVAVLDGGFNLRHPDLADGLLPWSYDAVDNDFDAHDEGNGYDDDQDGLKDGGIGHGTFAAGMVLRAAPEASILAVRVRDDEGLGTNEELKRGLWIAYLWGADVINISCEASDDRPKRVANMVRWLCKRGVLVVNSAGNEGRDEVSDLAKHGDSLVVGAVDFDDRLAAFSNHPAKPGPAFLLAPGVDLYGPLGIYGDDTSGYWSGTSFSTPLVSGAAALVLSQEPGMKPQEVMKRLLESVDPATDEHGRPLDYGRINLRKAVTR